MSDARVNNGGKRPNSGRKPKAEKHVSAIAAAENRLADRLPLTLTTLERLADGDVQHIEEEWVMAGTVVVDDVENYEVNGETRARKFKRRVFPDLEPDTLVLAKRKIVNEAPDTKANIYLADRVMGKPSDGDVAKVNDAVGTAYDAITNALQKILSPDDFQTATAALARLGATDGATEQP